MGTNSFWSLFSRDQLPSCPFCTEEHELGESRQILGAWYCSGCHTTFKLSKDELEPVYDFDPQAEYSRRRTCIGLGTSEAFGGSPGVGGLCRSCQHNQTIIIQLLSSFDPPQSSGSFEQLAGQYRRDLERRYPLCSSCKCYVDQKLQTLDMKLKSRKLAQAKLFGNARLSQLDQLKKEMMTEKSPSRLFSLINLIMDACSVLKKEERILTSVFDYLTSFDQAQYLLANIIQFMENPVIQRIGKITSRILVTEQLHNSILALGLFGIIYEARRSRGFWSAFLYFSLSGLRLALHKNAFPTEQIRNMAMGLMILIDLSLLLFDRRQEKKVAPILEDAPVLPGRIPVNPINDSPSEIIKRQQQPARSSPSKTIVNELMDMDWGLGSSRPMSFGPVVPPVFAPPLAASMTSATEKRSIFAPSKLDPNKAVSSMFNNSQRREPPAIPKFRHAVLQVPERPNGLESVMGGFSLKDTSKPSLMQSFSMPSLPKVPTLPSLSQMGIVGEIAMTGLFIGLRIMARDRLILISFILAASFVSHGPFWSRLPQEYKLGFGVTIFARFACLAAQLSEPDFAQLTLDSLTFRLLFLFLDLGILALR